MPKKIKAEPDRQSSLKNTGKDFEVLKNKLKLDDNIIGLLVNSRGSIKSKSFFNKVTSQINGN